MKHTLILILAAIAILVGTGFVMPAVAKLRSAGTLPGMDVALLLFGVSLTLVGWQRVSAAFGGRPAATEDSSPARSHTATAQEVSP